MQTPIKVILLSVVAIGATVMWLWLTPGHGSKTPQSRLAVDSTNTDSAQLSNPFVSDSGEISSQMLEFMVRDMSAKLSHELLTVFSDDASTATQIAELAEQKIRRDVALLSSVSNSQPWSLVNNATAHQASAEEKTLLEANRAQFEQGLTELLNSDQRHRFKTFERHRAEELYRNSATLFAMKLNIGAGGLSDDQVTAINRAAAELLSFELDNLPVGVTIGQQLLADKQRIPALAAFRTTAYNALTAEQKTRFADSLASSLIN